MVKSAFFIFLALGLWFSNFGSCALSRRYGLFKSTQSTPTSSKSSHNPKSFYSGARLDNLERLQKVISRAGVASRRDAEKLVSKSVVYSGPFSTNGGFNRRYWRGKLL